MASAVHLGVVLHRNGAVALRRQVDPLGLRLGPDGAHSLGDGIGEPGLLHMQGECPGFQPGHFDKGLHQEVQLVDLPVHRGQELRPLFRRQVVASEDAGKHFDVGDGVLTW